MIERTLGRVVLEASSAFKCVLVSGPRQVGKTTLLKSIADPKRRIVTLDDPLQRSLAKRDPALFLSTYPAPLLIDEVQYAPELFPYIKMRVDESEETGQYWLTGSQPFHLMKGVSESLAGRVAILSLQGLTEAEKAGVENRPYLPQRDVSCGGVPKSRAEMERIVFQGSFPQLAVQPQTDPTLFFGSYVATYLERDVRALINAAHEHEFLTFLACLAARTGQLLNATSLASDIGVSAPTVRAWISILESSGVIVLLRPYRTNLTKRATAMPKVYFSDTGLASYLCGFRTPDEVGRSPLWGHLFETWCVMAVLKSWWHSGRHCDAFFYRDRDGHEIDLLVRSAMRLHPMEIKSAVTPNGDEIETVFSVLSKAGVLLGTGAVACLSPESLPLSSSLICINAGTIGT